jgi:hypothetical protein
MLEGGVREVPVAPVTMESVWIAALIAAVPLAFVVGPVLVQILSQLRRRHGVAGASRGTPRT